MNETRKIRKSSGVRNVDAYRSTAPQRIDGDWVVITGYAREIYAGGYCHILTVRDCTPEELKRGKSKELKTQIAKMNVWPDDYRDREKFLAKKAELQNELKAIEN